MSKIKPDHGAELYKRGARPQKGRGALVPALIFVIFAVIFYGEGDKKEATYFLIAAVISLYFAFRKK